MWRARGGMRPVIAAAATVLWASGLVMPAADAAEVPVNDRWTGAISLRLGQTVHQDTTGATTDRVDARANEACGAPFTRASVWYTYKPKETSRFLLDMTQSDFSGGFMVFKGKPSASSLVTCGPGAVVFRGREGVRYYAVAFSDTRKQGGNLVLTFGKLLPPVLKLALDSTAHAAKDGTATVSGSVKCRRAGFLRTRLTLTQTVGRLKIVGSTFTESEPTCDGTWQPFTVVVASDTGLFGGGKAVADLSGLACSFFTCTRTTLSDVEVSLRRSAG